MSSLPAVPPRPSRSSAASPPAASSSTLPVIPARPVRNRSKSPLPQSGSADLAAAEAETTAPAVKPEESSVSSAQDASSHRPSSPEQKRKIDPELNLYQPMAVRPAGELPKGEDIPEIGQRVPMLDFAGDVQSPFPMDSRSASRGAKRRSQHAPNLPPEDGPMVVGDYGAYPSGSKVYRQTGAYSLSHDDLTKSVMHANGAGVATTPGLEGVPDEETGYAFTDEIASRAATPGGVKLPSKSPLSTGVSAIEGENDTTHQLPNLDEAGNDNHGIYGKGPSNVSSTSLTVPTSGRHTPWEEFQDEHCEGTPILASDEAGKYPVWNPPAISPKLSPQEVRRPSSSNISRTSPSITAEDNLSEPPSPTKEHAPLFPEGEAPPPKPTQRPKLDKQGSSTRFPSKDIWEDAPESTHVTYEVQGEENQVDPGYYDPRAAKKEQEGGVAQSSAESAKGVASPPPPPARPVKSTTADENSPVSPDFSKHVPAIPERPRPVVPRRPVKKPGDSSSTESPASAEEARAPPPTKPKPIIPGRVGGGGGIAALRANFMSDLNSRLSKGPVAPKKEETPEPEPKEREPLEDIRKSRARGPAKRKPTPAAGAAGAAESSGPKLTFSSIITVYSIGDDYEVSFDETKFNDEPSKVARPIGEKVIEKVQSGKELDTAKQVTAVDTSAAIVPESAEQEEEKEAPVPVPAEEGAEAPASSGPAEVVKNVIGDVNEPAAPLAEESKPEPVVEEKTVLA